MKVLLIMLSLFSYASTARAEGCDPVSKARAAAAIDLQSSDKFITSDDLIPSIKRAEFIGVTSPEKRNDYHIAVTFGTEEMRKNWSLRHAVYVISVNPESCLVQSVRLLGIGER